MCFKTGVDKVIAPNFTSAVEINVVLDIIDLLAIMLSIIVI